MALSGDNFAVDVKNSSMILQVAYAAVNQMLWVKFRGEAKCWSYMPVISSVAYALKNANSVGGCFNDRIRPFNNGVSRDVVEFDEAFEFLTGSSPSQVGFNIDWMALAGDGSIPFFSRI